MIFVNQVTLGHYSIEKTHQGKMCAAERPCKPCLMAKNSGTERKGRATQLIGWEKLKTEKSIRSSLNYCTDEQFEKREIFLIDQ